MNLSASNYEMAREVDMNLAEVDMETFRTQDLEPAFRLAYSSPVNDDILRLSGRQSRNMGCLLTNSTSFGLDRYVVCIFTHSPPFVSCMRFTALLGDRRVIAVVYSGCYTTAILCMQDVYGSSLKMLANDVPTPISCTQVTKRVHLSRRNALLNLRKIGAQVDPDESDILRGLPVHL